MKHYLFAGAATVLFALGSIAHAAVPDFNGVWEPVNPSATLKAADGSPPPLLKAARALYARNMAARKAGKPDFDATTQCKPAGVPRQMTMSRFDIMQSDKRLIFGFEWNREIRMVDIGATHDDQQIYGPVWYGFSTGKWDADTLVIDTVSYNDQTQLDSSGLPHSDQLHTVERLTLKDDGQTLEIRTTIEDPKTFSHSWDTVATFRKLPPTTEIQEDVCTEADRLN